MSGEYSFASSYQPGFSSFKNYGLAFPGYQGKITAGSLSMSTDARTANVIQEINSSLNMGIKNIELSQVSAQVLESIPKGHLKEVNRMAKLAGVDTTLHAPVLEVSGIGEGGFDETQRQAVERQLINAIDRAHELNPEKSAPVTIHASAGIPTHTWEPGEKGKMQMAKMIAINVEDGKLTPVDKEVRYYPTLNGEGIKVKAETPEEKLNILNNTKWSNSIFQIEQMRENADRILQDVNPEVYFGYYKGIITGQIKPDSLSPEQKGMINKIETANQFARQASAAANTLFSNAYEISKKNQNEDAMQKLKEIAKEYSAQMLGTSGEKISKISEKEKAELHINQFNPFVQKQALAYLTRELEGIEVKSFVPYQDFAVNKSADTFSNLALHSYKQYKDKAPIISIENPPAGGGFSTGEELAMLVEKTKEKFIEKVKADGMSTSKAKEVADNIIGVTWDVGHINMMRKQGFDEKEIIKQTEKIAPHLKHVHLSDNFGLEHTELPMGMGNVPLKEIMEKLGEKGYKASKVIEAMNWWQHFSQGGKHNPPFLPTLENLGGGFYSGISGGPYWNQNIGFQQGYSSGFGMMLPSVNYETFGAGFATLPAELGGNRPGAQGSRMSGREME